MIKIDQKYIKDFSNIKGKKDKDAAVCLCLKENVIILEKRKENEKDPWSGQISLPGGHFEEHDIYLINTAKREFIEETSINEFNILGGLIVEHPMNRSDMNVYVFLCESNKLEMARPQKSEIDYFLFPNINDLNENYGEYKFRNFDFKGFYYIYENNIIWGMTARIIKYFKEIISKS
ncbi:MAG: NUDIX hydrolase [Thermoplasmata archaeon]